MKNVPAPAAASAPVLRKGQRWDMAEQQLRIYRVGIHLVEFRLFNTKGGAPEHRLRRSSLETVRSVQDFLEKHHAVLGEG